MSTNAGTEQPGWNDSEQGRVLVVSSSPRIKGNSHCLAEAVVEGALAVGHDARLVHLPDHVEGFLRDCRACRKADGECAIDDDHRRIFLDLYVPAHAVVYATPIWWYGISGCLKTFLDRMFCYVSDSYPDVERVANAIPGKRAAAVLSAEETNLAARLAITTQLSEMCRYLHHEFVGVVVGIGNTRGELRKDPNEPLESARELGARMFQLRSTDYQLDTDRPKRIWDGETDVFPAYWR